MEIEKDEGNRDNMLKNLDIIIKTCEKMKEDLNKEEKSTDLKINLKRLNSIPFIYKPLTRKDYLSGDYLERFSEERTRELKEAGAIDIHNEFWIQHQPIKGNVFGSIPMELLSQKSVDSLKKNKWEEVMVNVYELLTNDVKIIIDYCNLNFKDYIIVKEKSTSILLVLHYEI